MGITTVCLVLVYHKLLLNIQYTILHYFTIISFSQSVIILFLYCFCLITRFWIFFIYCIIFSECELTFTSSRSLYAIAVLLSVVCL